MNGTADARPDEEPQVPRRAVRVTDRVRWSDVDAFGHVNNAAFLRILDDARFTTFPTMGIDPSGALTDTILVVGKHEVDYLAPLAFTTRPIEVELWVPRVGTSSVDFAYEVLDPEGKVCVRALSRMVNLDRAALRAVALPESDREHFLAHPGPVPRLRGW